MLRLLGAHDQAIISTYFPYYVSIGSIYPLVIVEVSEQPKLYTNSTFLTKKSSTYIRR